MPEADLVLGEPAPEAVRSGDLRKLNRKAGLNGNGSRPEARGARGRSSTVYPRLEGTNRRNPNMESETIGRLMFLGGLAIIGLVLFLNRNRKKTVIDERGTPADRVERARRAAADTESEP